MTINEAHDKSMELMFLLYDIREVAKVADDVFCNEDDREGYESQHIFHCIMLLAAQAEEMLDGISMALYAHQSKEVTA